MTYFAAIRCPHCGIYRLVGDPCDCRTKLPPVIIGEGDIDDQVRYAIRCVCGQDRVVLNIELRNDLLPEQFPSGTRLFVAISQSSMCEHSPRCLWQDFVYWYERRAVVVQQSQLSTTSLGNVIRQLKGE